MIQFNDETSRQGSCINLEKYTNQKCYGDSANDIFCCNPGKIGTEGNEVSSETCPVSSDCSFHHPTSETNSTQKTNLPKIRQWIIAINTCKHLASADNSLIRSDAIVGFHMTSLKFKPKKLSILRRFYFHDALEQLKTNFHTNFCFKRVLGFVIEYAWISKLLRDAAFAWRPRELSCRLKKLLISGNSAI